MRRQLRVIAGVGALLVLTVTGCTTVSTESDQVALHYDAGAFSSTTYQACVTQNNRTWDGPGERYYVYPAGQRTFDFTGNEGSESTPFVVVSKDNQELTVSGGLTFHLDTSCADEGGMLREFHEEIGLKFQPVMDGDGRTTKHWLDLLRFYIGQPLHKAMTTEAQKYDWLALYNDPATRAAFETAINEDLGAAVQATTGGRAYFLQFNLTLQKPTPRQDLVDGLAAVQVAITERRAIVEQNATVEEKLKQIRQLVEVLGPEGYILYEVFQRCLTDETAKGCPTFLPVPAGGSVDLNAGRPANTD
ncbi:SPFH domain-containing protein [Solwaraspora sp. WMMA2080]|uniref:SPFH domain-containing protein n=1 Tax=unclassified Solwaraspora TaxID=2627926 RepID=UPI00248C9342|nr:MULTISPECIES: SPFH domain-containing protein [unclassified Solwaraspora]WBB96173.1 SPFH domain-containing protein [Solwaraspora sp. WMMA2059]WBC19923.1 SPFH domain-containing protein [Solwaraspora sp. WMMA2080]